MSTRKVKVASEASAEVEEIVEVVSTSEAQIDTLTLDEFLSQHKVNEGLVASFRVEASKDATLLEPKSLDSWTYAFIAQSNRIYK